jgi:hypothetical protein
MIIALHYQYYDYSPDLYVFDTDKLDETDSFQKALKKWAEKAPSESKKQFEGADYWDDDDDVTIIPKEAMVKLPANVDKLLGVTINFE